ncbi:Hypothetical protein UVM_LOCUS202 [uncultured virus]|nr:Hypothetical protein UVM_LOCUS202 [uncultured virus]
MLNSFADVAYNVKHRSVVVFYEWVCEPALDVNSFYRHPFISNHYEATLLCHCVTTGNPELVQVCLTQRPEADPNLGYRWSNGPRAKVTPMFVRACSKGKHAYAIMLLLLAHGATPDQSALDEALKEAVWPLNVECVRWLLEHGANPNTGDDDSFPPLLLLLYRWEESRANEFVDAARLLLKHGADPTRTCRNPFYDGNWRRYLRRECHNAEKAEEYIKLIEADE